MVSLTVDYIGHLWYDNLTPIYNTLPTNDQYNPRTDLPYDNLTPIYNTLPINDQYSPRSDLCVLDGCQVVIW
jgi:hypothetical protein